jgi:hypothetical protein
MVIFILFFSLVFGGHLSAKEIPTLQGLDQDGYYLSLDDGTTWEVSWTNSWTSWNWKVGERVQIEKAEGEYRLSNLDQTSFIFAKPTPIRKYKQRVQNVFQGGNWIKLENGASWRIEKKHRDEVLTWRSGDEVILVVDHFFLDKELTYSFRNLRTFSKVKVFFHKQAEKLTCPRVEEFTWSHIKLTDGTKWAYTSFFQSASGWDEGDRVAIFTDLSNPTQYILFNYDASFYSQAVLYLTPVVEQKNP